MALEPITRAEQIMSGESLEPITREEMFLAKAAGMDVNTPEPITRREMFLSQISGGFGGPAPVVEPLSVTENGTYTAPSGVDGYNPVTVNVAGSGGDEWEQQFIAAIERDKSKPVTKLPEGLTKIGERTFYYASNVMFNSIPEGVTEIGDYAFEGAQPTESMTFPSSLDKMYQAFRKCESINSVTFKGTPTLVHTFCFHGCTNLLTINVPWAEGEVANAPWGAENATINYNYTGG